MQRSEHLNEIAAALAKAQGAFSAAERGHIAKVNSKKGEGSSYSYSYADLAAYLDVCREPLAAQGLAVVQSPTVNGDAVTVITLLTHASGQWIESDPLTLIADHDPDRHPTPQAIGSACTYARRYALSAMLAMASEVDDDGSSASGIRAETTKRAPRPVCPSCGKSEFVYENKQAPGWYCWKKPELQKLGCGHKWDTPLESSPTDQLPESKYSSGNVMSDVPPKLTEADARYIEEASQSFKEAKTDKEVRSLWSEVAKKSGAVKTALHPIYKDALNSFAGFTSP